MFVKTCHLVQFNDCLAELKSDCHLIRSLFRPFFLLGNPDVCQICRSGIKARANAVCLSLLENSITCKSEVFLLT